MKLVYKPIEIGLGIAAGLLGRRMFELVWSRIDGDRPPRPTAQDAPAAKAIGAAALEAAILTTVRAAVKRGGAVGWVRLTGTWPGDRRADADPSA
ncbi:MAG TPA: DUF4235 domain-containing protein [Solirubrobacteraceae bacterium]|jgi:hypothetical protein|nr:DUF4235 domain-containing protein [Solirubrobacteraceae bacterium]